MRQVTKWLWMLVMLGLVGCATVPPTSAPPTPAVPTDAPEVTATTPPPENDMAVNVDDFLRRLAGLGFRGAVLVAEGGEVVLAQGYGPLANSDPAPITPDTVFNIGSVSKAFTAAAILKLQDQGKLSVDDTLAEHLPNVPSDKAGITLHQLLTHTAGLDDAGVGSGDLDTIDKAAALEVILGRALLLPPGQESAYSNHGYILLAAVVEAASGQPFADYVRAELLLPAGMTSTGWWGADSATAGKPRASGVDNGVDRGDSADFPTPGWAIMGAGGMVSTANDLYRWHQAVQAGQVLSADAAAAYASPQFPIDEQASQGYGWVLAQTAPGQWLRIVGGDTPEVVQTTAIAWDMAADRVVIVNASNWAYLAGVVQRSVRRLAAGAEVPLPPHVTALDADTLAGLAGRYVAAEGGVLEVNATTHGLRLAATDAAAFSLLFPAEVAGPTGEPLDLAAEHARVLAYLDSERSADLDGWREEREGALGALTGYRVLGTAPLPGGVEPWTYVYFDFERGSALTSWVISPQGALQAGQLAAEAPAVEVFPVSATTFVPFTLGVPAALAKVAFAPEGTLQGATGAGETFTAIRE